MDVFEFVDSAYGDWDLQAIVRGCSSKADVISEPCSDKYAWLQCLSQEDDYKACENEGFKGMKIVNSGIPSIYDHAESGTSRVQKHKAEEGACANLIKGVVKEKRRKSKRKINFVVQQVAGDRALSDNWNWRKYGQKAIKGSPYPRSYYKCSSSGECLARKQVEHNSNDPGTFLITYIDGHNHPYPTRRHSQAGRTKERFDASSRNMSSDKPSANTSSIRTKITSLESPIEDDDRVMSLKSDKDDGSLEDVGGQGGGGGDVDVSNMMWDDEFFSGLECLDGFEMDLLCDDGFSFDRSPNVP